MLLFPEVRPLRAPYFESLCGQCLNQDTTLHFDNWKYRGQSFGDA